MLVAIATILLFFIWRLREPESKSQTAQQE
jgi:hypothetical protein